MSDTRAASVAAAFVAACDAELTALKPGNVHRYADGHTMRVADFERAARVAVPFIADAGLKPGARILGAVEASLRATGTNTNLGICLLCVPLAAGFEAAAHTASALRPALHTVLGTLGPDDAVDVFKAIRLANPGGLGTSGTADVASTPTIPLLQAMALAAPRDAIAREYVTDYRVIFNFALPALITALALTQTSDLATTTLHMALLAARPDSHIARKFGSEVASTVRDEATALNACWQPVARPETMAPLLAFDGRLKARGLNPGTTADFVVATLFLQRLEAILLQMHSA